MANGIRQTDRRSKPRGYSFKPKCDGGRVERPRERPRVREGRRRRGRDVGQAADQISDPLLRPHAPSEDEIMGGCRGGGIRRQGEDYERDRIGVPQRR